MASLTHDFQDPLITIRVHKNLSLTIRNLTRATRFLKLQVVDVVRALASTDVVHENEPRHVLHRFVGVSPRGVAVGERRVDELERAYNEGAQTKRSLDAGVVKLLGETLCCFGAPVPRSVILVIVNFIRLHKRRH